MNRSARIRGWLATQDGPRSTREMAEGTGEDPMKVSFAVGVMLRDGLMDRVRHKRPCTYVVAREVRSPIDREARAAAGRTRRQQRPEVIEARRLREAEKQRLADERAAKRKRAVQASRAEAKRRKAEADRLRRLAKVLESAPEPAKPEPVQAQTVEEFLAMGGKVERLETKQLARPIGYVGWSDNYGVAA